MAPDALLNAGANVKSNPLLVVADAHGVEFPGPCLLYSTNIASWELSPGQLSLPAPPEDAFGVLTSASEDAGGSAAARRLMSSSIMSALVVNDEEVASTQMTYDANAGPQLLSVTPSIISAAMPEVCNPATPSLYIRDLLHFCPPRVLFFLCISCSGIHIQRLNRISTAQFVMLANGGLWCTLKLELHCAPWAVVLRPTMKLGL